ncbi:heme lyase CcmF/NrfE family subunit [Flagellatimonas centrodinii]|uniref:heme lyase CcmF/NrfE family subunit n=1 Tax=Flagellatimonas centrodinii TaxID=2806210 RepID=UPI001FFC8C5F|nr:heme lyase CcmF/NrfE family subunit [Flagellatimonas centrodinii]ULQ46491.1 heme lyase CcmF/NrfE family subunit [Flagellatimonas centrodinii]
MSAELGHFALLLTLAVAVLMALLPAYGVWRGDTVAMRFGRTAALVQFGLVTLAYVCLTTLFVVGDFSVAYVASNSHSELPLAYRISAVWGAHEGSLLLWVLMLAGWTAAVALFNRRLPLPVSAIVLSVLGAISIGFLLFMILTSNPFERVLPIPADGQDLNPLLQDPGLIIHPPLLYMGYVGFSVAFAFALAALITGKLDAAWARWTRPWTTAAWLFLTLGITLGSWWAYHELGWGGWWFWDPVENASLMPWLVGTALIHSLAVTEKRGLLKSWTVLLAILAFALSLLGTFLVRSGVLVSVHAFATDPARGVFILGFLAVVLGTAFGLYAWRAPRLASPAPMTLWSREGLLLFNNVFLVVAAAAVLLGTLWPLLADALGLGKLSVGPPYFNAVFVPLTLPLAVLVGLAGAVNWKRARMSDVWARLRTPAALSVILAVAIVGLMSVRWGVGVVAGAWLGSWTLVAALAEPLRRWRQTRRPLPRGVLGMSLAHAGLGVLVLGVTFVSQFSIERDVRLGPGQSADLAGYHFTFDGVTPVDGPNYDAERGVLRVSKGDRELATLHPEKRFYRGARQVMTDADVDHTPFRDLYASLGESIGDQGEWALRLYYKPMMRLVWWAGVIMALGGLLAISDRRYRLSAKAGD